MRLVPIQCVKENFKLAKDIYDNDGKILLKAGTKLKNPVIKKIKNLNIFSLYVIDENSENIIEEIIKPEIRQRVIKTIKDIYGVSAQGYELNYMSKKKEDEFESIAYIAKELIEEVFSRKEIMLNIVDIKNLNNYMYQHSVNVAVISLVIGIKLDLHKYDLLDLCVGALLHDFGMAFIPNEIITKDDKLAKDEYEVVKKHAKLGYDFLSESFEIPLSSLLVVLQHHEKIGGQGYPQGKDGSKISKFAKIVAIADVYDALTSDRHYRSALSPNEALEYIMANGGIEFDYNLVKVFSKSVIPYPQGTIIRLTNNEVGVVKAVNKNMPLRPEIEILESKDEDRIGRIIDLEKNIDIVVKGIYYK